MRSKPPTFNIGDRVAYSAAFCRSIGDYTDTPHWRGTVEDVKEPLKCGARTLHRIVVRWDGEYGGPSAILAENLAHVGPNLRFCEC